MLSMHYKAIRINPIKIAVASVNIEKFKQNSLIIFHYFMFEFIYWYN